MSLKDCIDSALRQGHITREEARDLKKLHGRLAATIKDPLQVKKRLIADIAAEVELRRRRAGLTERARKGMDADFGGHRNASGEMDMAEAYLRMHESVEDGKIKDAEYAGRLAILAMVHGQIASVLNEFKRGAIVGDKRRTSKLVGNRRVQARMMNVVRELFGESTGDAAAKEFATVLGNAMEDLRVRFNDAGGAVGKLEKWGLPQFHDQEALLTVGKEKWVAYLMRDGVLDRERMVNPLTKRPLTDDELREALAANDVGAYDRITTDGWSDREAAGVPVGRGSLATQHADHRFLHFKSADAWLKYAEDFGNPDPYQAIMAHLGLMARDIAHMERFGPNPAALREYGKQRLLKDARMRGGDAVRRANKAIARADHMWEYARGTLNTPVDSRVADVLSTTRNIITASSLGSAVISSLSDAASGGITRAFVGMGPHRAEPVRVIAEALKYIGPENRRDAVRSELILDSAMHVTHQQARYTGSIDTRSLSGYIADRVISWQGLAAWTQGAKHAFGKAMQAMFADHVDRSWGKLPELVRRTLERHGFDREAWDQIRAVRLYEPKQGAVFLRSNEIRAALGRDLAERYTAMLLREIRHAVPESTIESKAMWMGGTRPGTVPGELLRAAGQFKSFAIAVIMIHQRRIAAEMLAGHKGTGAAYAGALLISSTLLGLVAGGLKDIKDGRDPKRWFDPNSPVYIDPVVWMQATLQGGGLGIYGDFLLANVNRHGGSLTQTVAGPLWDRLGAIKDLTFGNAAQLAQGKPTNFGREAVRVARQNMPGGNLWFWNIAYQRMLMDQVQRLADPEAHRSFNSQVSTRRKDYNQEFWWSPGETTPQRAPNPGAITGR